jgi:hypothetical protein
MTSSAQLYNVDFIIVINEFLEVNAVKRKLNHPFSSAECHNKTVAIARTLKVESGSYTLRMRSA